MSAEGDSILSHGMQAFCRDFSWSELMLWPEDMPPETVICMSGADKLVPSDLVLLHLKAACSPAKTSIFPHL